jgi:hypothetical protein
MRCCLTVRAQLLVAVQCRGICLESASLTCRAEFVDFYNSLRLFTPYTISRHVLPHHKINCPMGFVVCGKLRSL